jgi:hypothetical protein
LDQMERFEPGTGGDVTSPRNPSRRRSAVDERFPHGSVSPEVTPVKPDTA